MRTAIFVYEPIELSIITSEDNVVLEALAGLGDVKLQATPLRLAPGVYKVRSRLPLKLGVTSAVSLDVEIVTGNDHDDVPEPRPKLKVTEKAFRDFFPVIAASNEEVKA